MLSQLLHSIWTSEALTWWKMREMNLPYVVCCPIMVASPSFFLKLPSTVKMATVEGDRRRRMLKANKGWTIHAWWPMQAMHSSWDMVLKILVIHCRTKWLRKLLKFGMLSELRQDSNRKSEKKSSDDERDRWYSRG
mgnify:CR=1 FL=1